MTTKTVLIEVPIDTCLDGSGLNRFLAEIDGRIVEPAAQVLDAGDDGVIPLYTRPAPAEPPKGDKAEQRNPCILCGAGPDLMTLDQAKLILSLSGWSGTAELVSADAIAPVFGSKTEQATGAERMDAIYEIADKLRKAGAKIPAPAAKGTVESGIETGLSVALAIVDDYLRSQAGSKEDV